MQLLPLSKTKYETFKMCPYKADLIYNVGLKDRQSDAAETGVLAHQYIQDYLSGRISDTEIPSPFRAWVDFAVSSTIDYGELVGLELHIHANSEGECQPEASEFHGILDAVFQLDEKSIHVVDWKSGGYVKDNEFERHLYAGVLARAKFNVPRISFSLVYVGAPKRVITSQYLFNPDGSLQIIDPYGNVAFRKSKDAMLRWIQAKLKHIAKTPPTPRVGRHCTNQFGQPCVFLGKECQASYNLPFLHQSVSTDELRNAVRNVLNGEATRADYSYAMEAAMVMRDAASEIEARVKEFTMKNGPISAGGVLYGPKSYTRYDLDERAFLEALAQMCPSTDDLAEILTTSMTRLKQSMLFEALEEADKQELLKAFKPVIRTTWGKIKGGNYE